MSTGVYTLGMAQRYLDDYPRADDHLPDGDPIGPREMAELTGRTIQAVYKWHERKVLCPADGPMVDGRPTWRRRTFLAWAYRQTKTRQRQPNGDPGPPLPIHAEAEKWAARVDPDAVIPVRDMERRQARRAS